MNDEETIKYLRTMLHQKQSYNESQERLHAYKNRLLRQEIRALHIKIRHAHQMVEAIAVQRRLAWEIHQEELKRLYDKIKDLSDEIQYLKDPPIV